jgi:uncharacterized phage protein (TIGR01671 family)
MKDIKFRAWSPNNGCWCGAFSIHQSGAVSDMIDAKIDKDSGIAISDAHWGENDLVIMQYTGLKDKNGVEIYEGDIVEIKEIGSDKFTVNFRNGCFWVDYKAWEILLWTCVKNNDAKVIGNIYENGNLLK